MFHEMNNGSIIKLTIPSARMQNDSFQVQIECSYYLVNSARALNNIFAQSSLLSMLNVEAK